MYDPASFEYRAQLPASVDVVVDESVEGKQALLELLAQKLAFPSYFGFNWDALIDCLSDMSWCASDEIVVVHRGLPRLSARDTTLYLQSLCDAAARRRDGQLPHVRIVFRVEDRGQVAAALNAAT